MENLYFVLASPHVDKPLFKVCIYHIKKGIDPVFESDYNYTTYRAAIQAGNKKERELLAESDIRYRLVFTHSETSEIITSDPYTPEELLKSDLEQFKKRLLTCNGHPAGDTNAMQCTCAKYFRHYEFTKIIPSHKTPAV